MANKIKVRNGSMIALLFFLLISPFLLLRATEASDTKSENLQYISKGCKTKKCKKRRNEIAECDARRLKKLYKRLCRGTIGTVIPGPAGDPGPTGPDGCPGQSGPFGTMGAAGTTAGATGATGATAIMQPFSHDLFVDLNSTSPIPEDGSLQSPFTTLQASLDFIATDVSTNNSFTIFICTGDYTGEGVVSLSILNNLQVELIALGNVTINGLNWTVGSSITSASLALRTVNSPMQTLYPPGSPNGITTATPPLFYIQSAVTLTNNSAVAPRLEVNGSIVAGSVVNATPSNRGNLYLYQCEIGTVGNPLTTLSPGDPPPAVGTQGFDLLNATGVTIVEGMGIERYGTIECCNLVPAGGNIGIQITDGSVIPSQPTGLGAQPDGFLLTTFGANTSPPPSLPPTLYSPVGPSIRLDATTNYWFVNNGVLRSTGATKTIYYDATHT